MIDYLSQHLPAAVTDYLPEALDNLDIAPASLRKASTWDKALDLAPSIIVILLLGWLANWLVGQGLRLYRHLKTRRTQDPEAIKRVETVTRVLRYAFTVLITLGTFLLAFDKMGIAVAPLLGAAGIVGIAVGFGAQSLVKDYFTGLFLIVENQLRQGDVVEVGGKGGLVEEVTLRYVRLRDYEGYVHFVPNSLITTVTNKSRGFAFAVMDIGIAYKENTDTVVLLMKEVGAELCADPVFSTKILEPLDVAGVEQWADSAVIIRCRFKVVALEQWNVKREYLRRLKQRFDRAGIEIPFPHMTVYPGQAGATLLAGASEEDSEEAPSQD